METTFAVVDAISCVSQSALLGSSHNGKDLLFYAAILLVALSLGSHPATASARLPLVALLFLTLAAERCVLCMMSSWQSGWLAFHVASTVQLHWPVTGLVYMPVDAVKAGIRFLGGGLMVMTLRHVVRCF